MAMDRYDSPNKPLCVPQVPLEPCAFMQYTFLSNSFMQIATPVLEGAKICYFQWYRLTLLLISGT